MVWDECVLAYEFFFFSPTSYSCADSCTGTAPLTFYVRARLFDFFFKCVLLGSLVFHTPLFKTEY